MDTSESAAILAQLYTVWPKQGTDDSATTEVALWQWAFKNDPYQTVQEGINMWVMGGKPFMPKPSDIRHMIAERAVSIDADEWWGIIRKDLTRYGKDRASSLRLVGDSYEEVPAPTYPPIVEAVIASIGWKEMCLGETDEIRKALIFGIRNRVKLERDNLIFGNKSLSVALTTLKLEELEAGDVIRDDEDPDR